MRYTVEQRITDNHFRSTPTVRYFTVDKETAAKLLHRVGKDFRNIRRTCCVTVGSFDRNGTHFTTFLWG